MHLKAGDRLGPYEVIAAIGAGGMGEVYRARDVRLQREVALKILPDALAADPDRLSRFEREARVLASLNHSNIAQIYGFEEAPLETPASGHGGAAGSVVRALVMELVDGEDLSGVMARGPVPPAEALAVGRQIAEALEAAHDAGIVHRDLKPANIKVRKDGTVKVLDFGLAKAAAAEGASGAIPSGAISGESLTMTSPAMTQMGIILGTASYMSPEQARGKPVDRRADIWSFGVVLFEMLTGRRLFTGETMTDVVASVVRDEVDWNALPAGTPDVVRRLLTRCLDRDVKRRLQAIGEARLTLEEAISDLSSLPKLSDSLHSTPGGSLMSNVPSVSANRGAAPSETMPASSIPPPGSSMSSAASSVSSPSLPSADASNPPPSGIESGALASAAGRTRARKRVPWTRLAILAVAAVASVALVVKMRRQTSPESSVQAAGSSGRSIAVLPFVNSSGSKDDEYLADGMTDELIASLGKVPGLRVAARSSAFAFKGQKVEMREIARKLGVDTVLEGTLRRSGKRLRVTASLASASDGLQLWASTFESEGRDPFEVQDQVTRGVVSGLSLQLAGAALSASQAGRTKDPEAHDLYLRGLASSNAGSEADLRRALDHYQQALVRDPDFALAYTGIAWVHEFLADAYVAPSEAYPKAKAAAEAAIQRDDQVADAHALLAYCISALDWGNRAGVEKEFDRALQLDPNSANTLFLRSSYRSLNGRIDEAIADGEHAARLDPLSPIAPMTVELANFTGGRYEATVEAHRRTEAIDPGFVYADSWAGAAYREMGNYPAALREYTAATRSLGGQPMYGLALTYHRMGRDAEARELMRTMDRRAATQYVSLCGRAAVHAVLGDLEGAGDLLQQAVDKREIHVLIVRTLPEMEPLFKTPRGRKINEEVDAILKGTPARTTLGD